MKHAATPESNYFTNSLGGAVTTSEPGAGWGTRGGVPAPEDPLTPECEAWVADFGEALQPFVGGAYVNVPNAGMPDWETAYWGSNVDRLRTVKAKYDPTTCSATNRVCRPSDR